MRLSGRRRSVIGSKETPKAERRREEEGEVGKLGEGARS